MRVVLFRGTRYTTHPTMGWTRWWTVMHLLSGQEWIGIKCVLIEREGNRFGLE